MDECTAMGIKEKKREYVSDIVFNQLRQNIYQGDFRYGEKLPPEQYLAQILHVSKSSVRQAKTLLVERGYLEKQEGKGYFVKMVEPQDPQNLFSSVMAPRQSSLTELLEVRIGLETHGVVLAAEKAEYQDLRYIESALATFTSNPSDRLKARDADIKFHMGIAFATHNSVYIDLLHRFYDYLFHSISTCQTLIYEQESNLDIVDKQHFKIYDAVKTKDIRGAKRYMWQHITFLKSFIVE